MSQVIWCISKYALPPEYGAQHRLFKLSEEFNKKGFSSIVISSSTNHLADLPHQKELFKKVTIKGHPAIFIKGILFKSSLAKRRVLSWVIFELYLFFFLLGPYKRYTSKPDIIIVSSLSLLTIMNGWIAKKIFRAKLIFEIRDIWPLSTVLVAGYSEKHPLVRLLRAIEIFGYRNADAITSPLENLSEHIDNSINAPYLFFYIPHGFDVDSIKAQPLSSEFLQSYIPKNKFIIGYIGNIVKAYDLETMLKCAEFLERKHPNIHFLVLGDGNHKEQLMADAAHLSNITFIPRIPKSQVASFLARCHIVTNYLIPKPLFRYGVSPQKLIDYMMAGKPIIMSYTGFPSLISKIGCGEEVEAGNIKELTEVFIKYSRFNEEELKSIGDKGRKYLLKNLSWESIAERYLKVISSIS